MQRLDNPEIFREVLEDLPTGVYLVARDGCILFWNRGAERITGHLRQDVVGRPCREDFLGNSDGAGEEVSAAAAALEAILRDGKAIDWQVSFRHKTGHLVPVRLRATPMRDARGSIIGAVETFDEAVDIAESDRRHSKLAEYGCLDTATGVLNHKMIESRLRECLATFAESHVPFCVLSIAFDHLPDVQSRYGNAAIAAVLRLVGQNLESSLRPTDFLGRWNENEFLAIVVECSLAEISKVADRLRKTLRTAKIKWWGDALPVTASMGATAAKPEDTIPNLIQRAEGALRESMAQGGDRAVLWCDNQRPAPQTGNSRTDSPCL
jgi:diguanylate cyclase (GGDEF)-like protein/PAS domain S-box-containing protein